MFKSGLTKGMFKGFLQSLQLDRSQIESTPFIYVDPDLKEVRFLTNLMSCRDHRSEILAFSVASEGNVEVLSTEG